MLKGRGRDPRGAGVSSPAPGHPSRPVAVLQAPRTPLPLRQQLKPEPDYEVVEFPSDQYVNAKLQPPPPPPPRPPTGHPAQAGASCGLCGGGGARVRCAECGRRALCASCDDMYHRHPKRRHHQRQALSPSQLSEDRPPLPPKTVAPPVPPPRRHKMSASPKPPTPLQDPRHVTLVHPSLAGMRPQPHPFGQSHQLPVHVQPKMAPSPGNIGSMPFLNTMPHPAPPAHPQMQSNTLGHLNSAWSRPRGSLQGFNMPQMAGNESWESPPAGGGGLQAWSRPLRRGASVLELGGAGACAGCAHCAPSPWRYGSCASLDHAWPAPGWPAPAPPPPCCATHQHVAPHHPHHLAPQTPQAYRRADSRTMSRAASRTGSRAASPAHSVRSRASRRNKHRTPSPPVPSSDADSESESDESPAPRRGSRSGGARDLAARESAARDHIPREPTHQKAAPRDTAPRDLSPADAPPAPPPAPAAPWHCEHCTYVNEPGVRVCAVCCRTPTAPPRVADLTAEMEGLHISEQPSSPVRVRESPRFEAPEKPKRSESMKSTRERTSTGCGPSPPLERRGGEPTGRLVTPTREQNGAPPQPRSRHDMAVGPSPPKDIRTTATQPSPLREANKTVRVSPYRETKGGPVAPQRHSVSVGPSPPRHSIKGPSPPRETNRHSVSAGSSPPREITKHSVSAGPSPPREITRHSVSAGPSPPRETNRLNMSAGPSPPRDRVTRNSVTTNGNFQKKSAGTSPPPDVRAGSRSSAPTTKTNNTRGTSPPPQSISTQTYEEASLWERGGGGGGAVRSRRRLRDDARRERSRSRHSLSSDTRESERSVRTAAAGWEWREREASPPAGEWGGRLARRASHLDLRRRTQRRSSFYGSEAASPEPHARAASVEALASGRRGLELARLLADAERLGYDAAEVQVALGASPEAPLEWLRARWAGLAGAVRGAAARLAPHAPLSEREARAALSRHRGAVWPAVTECVDALRRQGEAGRLSAAGRVRGRVWGSPVGADDDAAAPRARAEYYSSDEFDPPAEPYEEEWGPPPPLARDSGRRDSWGEPPPPSPPLGAEAARALRSLLAAGDNALLRDLLAPEKAYLDLPSGPTYDLIQSENEFINAYNALTRASPLPNIGPSETARTIEMDHDYSRRDDEMRSGTYVNENSSKTQIRNEPHRRETQKNGAIRNNLKATSPKINLSKQEPKKAKIKIIQSENQKLIESGNESGNVATSVENQKNEIKSAQQPLQLMHMKQGEEKSSNLNDIVDDTQRLIQQMKDEINSDITSLDEGHAQTSQSEHESSTNDEREESSYSETEEETDNMSSDEKDMSSEEEYEGKIHAIEGEITGEIEGEIELEIEGEIEEHTKNTATFPNRTSSEDNEQFEEALDNLDNQIEDVKHANIEILNSIARSLQEEHTIIVEINQPVIPLNEKENTSKLKSSKKQDSNNNKLFVSVNSFDEIYAELDTPNNNGDKINRPESVQPVTAPVVHGSATTTEIIEPKVLLTKHAINELTLKLGMPTKLLISESVDPTFNAIIETIEISEESEEENQQAKTAQVEIANNKGLTNGRNKSKSTSPSSDSESSQNAEVEDTSNSIKAEEIVVETVEIKIEDPVPAPVIDKEPIIEPAHSENNTPSVEKVLEIPSKNDNATTKTVIVKSNIPKPIKASPNIKAKVDKLGPKLIVSKVPVRRGSLKQYPAPAPPKAHFGNVQSGHVKQLQSKIFNDTTPAKLQKPVTIDVKPSTSTATLSKKKPAPPPPAKSDHNQKQATPPQASPPKEKRNYFRETCRTEDEWTDSDSEDSQQQVVRPTESKEEPQAPPSPPPPPTVRRVSGQIIDLATVQLPEGSPERQARMLLAGGALETWEQAQLAVELVGRGAAPPAALLAALDCADLSAALAYLHQDCELCATRDLPEHEMVSMLSCTHRCCRECARLYFTVQVTERSVADCVCPYCKLPELEALPEDAWLDYFAHLDIMLKALLDPPVHELFQRKLRDRTLARDPNFRWCVECSSGFFVHPKHKKLRCPECRSVTCAACRKPWSSNHEGLSCEQYTAWLEDNDPERAAAAVQQHLRDNGLECPRCRFKYSLSRGGCMHFTCTQCKFEFCYGCGKPFTMGARCGLSEYCAKLGLHAHHPRNCLFYLRDKEPHELQTLLQMNNVSYETQAPEGSTGRCPVQLQRETPAGLVDGVCGSEAPPNYAGLCKNHYLEYLSRLVRARRVDPLPLLAVDDLETLVRRAALRLPPRPYGSLEGVFRRALDQIVREKIPLD